MKIEPKHLAPYLPYEIKEKEFENDSYIATLIGINNDRMVTVSLPRFPYQSSKPLRHFKPLLRPLSDLTKEITHNGETFVPCKMFSGRDNSVLSSLNNINHPYDTMYKLQYVCIEKLFEWHIDVFGLIEKGLAIDLNTLEQ